MIRVRVTRAGLAGASSFLALASGLAACTNEAADDAASSSSADTSVTTMDPGTGVLSLQWVYDTPSGYSFAAQNSVDEYVRVGETMSFTLTPDFLWQRLHPTEPLSEDVSRLEQISATINVVFFRGGAQIATRAVTTTGWTGDAAWDLVATTSSFQVAAGADTMRFEVAVHDAADATASASYAQTDFHEVAVFGGALPGKTLLFDTFYAAMRQRVIEGGLPVHGSTLALGYTDWRAATLMDSTSIDRTIGTATEYGRFGSFPMTIQGNIEYEIAGGAAVDDAWQPEQALTANASSRLLDPRAGRTAYEGSLAIPGGAKKLDFYFHVKAYLVADYSSYGGNVTWKKYGDGQRILVREKWDNLNGVVGSNYDFGTE